MSEKGRSSKIHREARNCIRQRVSHFPYYFIYFFIPKTSGDNHKWRRSSDNYVKRRKLSSLSRRKSSRAEFSASSTCFEKLMWKLLLRRTKWKTEHFWCFFMRWGGGEGKWVEIGGLCLGFGEISFSAVSSSLPVCIVKRAILCSWCSSKTIAMLLMLLLLPFSPFAFSVAFMEKVSRNSFA